MEMRRIALPEGTFCQSRGVRALVMPRVVRRPVVRIARCAEVVRTLVVPKPRYGQPDTRCAWFRLTPVVDCVIPDERGSDQRSLCRRGSVPVWEAHATRNPKD